MGDPTLQQQYYGAGPYAPPNPQMYGYPQQPGAPYPPPMGPGYSGPPGGYGGSYPSYGQPQTQPPPQGYNPPYPPNMGLMGASVLQAAGSNLGGGDDKLLTEDLPIDIRHGFVRKVYGVLSVQLLLTFGLALMFNLWKTAGDWLLAHAWLSILSMVCIFVLLIVLVCVPGVAQSVPINFILLMIFSAFFGVMLGFAGARTDTPAFAMAMGITAVVVIALSCFACQTRWDFTGSGTYLFVAMIVLMVFGIVCAIIRNRIAHIVYASLGALLFSFYLVYDTQRIVGGKHRKFQYSIDDYIFAALSLYMDIINLFSYILMIISSAQSN